MNEEMRVEAMELCVTACEKFSTNNEVCEAFVKRVFFDCVKRSGNSITLLMIVSFKNEKRM